MPAGPCSAPQPRTPAHSRAATPPLPQIPSAPHPCRMHPQDSGCAHRDGQTPCPRSPGGGSSRRDTRVPPCRASATPRGTWAHQCDLPGPPHPVGVLGTGVTPRAPLWAVLEPPCRPLSQPGVGLQRKSLFGLELAFSVSRAAQGANGAAEQIDGSSGRRKGNFLDEACGGWEHFPIPVTMWGSTASRGRHCSWHSIFWALPPLGCSWSCGHFGMRGIPCENVGVPSAA